MRTKPGYTLDFLNSPIWAIFALLQWLSLRKGPMATLGCPGAAFVRVDDDKLVFVIPLADMVLRNAFM